MLSDFGGSDTVNDRVETTREQQIHDAAENTNTCRKTVTDPVRQESDKSDSQAYDHDHDVGDAGVKCFDP